MDRGRIVLCGTPAELKANLPEKCYAIRANNLREIKHTLEARPGVSSVEMSGASLHLFLKPDAKLLDIIADLDIDAERITPTLEDILISEIQRAAA